MLSLLPLIVFIIIYLGTSIVIGDFYKVPIAVAFLISSIVSIVMYRGHVLAERMKAFSHGASSENMMMMIWIFILAGAFASSAKEMGSIDNTVNMALSLLPAHMIMAGIFIAACFISISIGTSVGTIVALMPVAAGLAAETGTSIAMMTGVVVGGAMFGDNLSFISDTTVVATRTQGCRMSDKFYANISIVLPAAFVIFVVYILLGANAQHPTHELSTQYIKVLPYLTVLITAACGLNVIIVLTIGILLTGIIGIFTGAYDIFGFMHAINTGIMGMAELIIITMLAGGMLEIVKRNGGINYIIKHLSRHIKGRRGGEAVIAVLTVIVNFCTANNTVTIITVGPIAKQIANTFGIDPRRSASILDTFSCFAQGIIPYGAQLLMASALAAITPLEVIPNLFYPLAVGITATIAIIISKKSLKTKENGKDDNI